MQTQVRLTRAELYEKVWATPMRLVAKEFGLSDVGLSKICDKHNIPVPPRGHWRREETGHEVTRPPLQPSKNGFEGLDIYVRKPLEPELAALAAEPAPKVVIREELSHLLVARTEKLLAQGKENDAKLLVPKKGTASHLYVSHEHLPRALRIMNALFLALEERGHSISWPKEEEATLSLGIDGQTVSFCLKETTDSVRHAPTPEEAKHPWMAPKWDYKLTGKLQFRIENVPSWMGPMRSTWSDGKLQRLEKCLGDIVVGLKVVAGAIKKHKRDIEERDKRWEEERKQEQERKRRAEEHKRKAEFIAEMMRNWEDAQRLRTFVKALAERSTQLELPDGEKQNVQQVVDWTAKYAEFLDPLTDLPNSIDEFICPEKKYPWLRP